MANPSAITVATVIGITPAGSAGSLWTLVGIQVSPDCGPTSFPLTDADIHAICALLNGERVSGEAGSPGIDLLTIITDVETGTMYLYTGLATQNGTPIYVKLSDLASLCGRGGVPLLLILAGAAALVGAGLYSNREYRG